MAWIEIISIVCLFCYTDGRKWFSKISRVAFIYLFIFFFLPNFWLLFCQVIGKNSWMIGGRCTRIKHCVLYPADNYVSEEIFLLRIKNKIVLQYSTSRYSYYRHELFFVVHRLYIYIHIYIYRNRYKNLDEPQKKIS